MIEIKCIDNLKYMAEINDNTIDLIYCDILYGTGRKFKDYQDLKPIRSEIENHYFPRLKEMNRILKSTGSIYLQMDTRINHWIRCIMDDVFGHDNFINEIVWCYRLGGTTKNKFDKKHDVILFYTKSKNYIFNMQLVKKTGDNHANYTNQIINNFKNCPDYWSDFDLGTFSTNHPERNGYATQKPKALIERIIKASSNEGDLVADFYAGSFTTAEVCSDLNRNFVGCDINPNAVDIGRKRILNNFEKIEAGGQINLWSNLQKADK